MNILLLTNSSEQAQLIKSGLEEKECNVLVAYDMYFGEKILSEKKFDVIILDSAMNEANYFETCAKIRNLDANAHLIALSDVGLIEKDFEGIDCTVDDYLLKPCNLNELHFRLRVFNKKKRHQAMNTFLKFSDLEVDTASKKIKRNNKEIKLTAREYKLLELFLLNRGRVLDRNEIAEKIWGFNINAGVNVINVHVNTLRNKIDKGFSPKLIHTLIGLGYVMRVDE